MITGFCLKCLSFMQLNSADAVNELTSSVPKSSIISKSQSSKFEESSLATLSLFFLKVFPANISNNLIEFIRKTVVLRLILNHCFYILLFYIKHRVEAIADAFRKLLVSMVLGKV